MKKVNVKSLFRSKLLKIKIKAQNNNVVFSFKGKAKSKNSINIKSILINFLQYLCMKKRETSYLYYYYKLLSGTTFLPFIFRSGIRYFAFEKTILEKFILENLNFINILNGSFHFIWDKLSGIFDLYRMIVTKNLKKLVTYLYKTLQNIFNHLYPFSSFKEVENI